MNWWRAGKRPQEQELAPERHREVESQTAPQREEPILSLQRAVGNREVQKMLPHSEGEPIAEDERQRLESSYGQDLNDVRVHRDEEANELAASVGANAFTSGRDIYFARGAYCAGSPLAHEVGHVVQQSQATSFLPGEDAFLEHQADRASSAVMSGHAAEIAGVAAAPSLQRQAAPGAKATPATQAAPSIQPAPGYSPPAVKLMPTSSLTLDNFDVDKFELNGDHKQKLDAFAQQLKGTLSGAPESVITITGYADAPGTEPHNLALGQQRAETVRAYLVSKGISENQLRAGSLGEGSPAVASKAYESKNRRVEISVVARSFFHPQALSMRATPAPVPAAPPAKVIDLRIHREEHDPTPSEELQEKMRQVDKAVREAQAAEKSNPGVSAADLAGRVLRNAAKKLGLPSWIQDRAESLGKDLPAKGANAVVDQIAGERGLDADTQNALKALVEALMKVKVK